jgi:sugar phosphate isomerase/epimerase
MTEARLPVVGAALPIARLPEHAEWLIEGRRDLELYEGYEPEVLDGDWRPLVRRVREVLDGFSGRRPGRLGIHGPYYDLTVLNRDPKFRALVADRLRQALELGAELGATHMVVHSPFEFFGDATLPHSADFGLDAQIELVHATLDPIVPTARQAGITLMIENCYDKNPAPLLALVRSFGDGPVRMSLDVGHAFVTHQVGGPPPDEWVRAAGDRLGHLHLQDTDGRYDRHWMPGEGSIDWHALFRELGALPHRPRLILEDRDGSRVREGAAWLAEQGLAR